MRMSFRVQTARQPGAVAILQLDGEPSELTGLLIRLTGRRRLARGPAAARGFRGPRYAGWRVA